MRLFLGAIVGLLLGSLLLAVITSQYGDQGYWPMLPVGLAVGLCVRNFAIGKYGGYPGGALAVLATLAAMVVGPIVATKMIVNQRPMATTNTAAIERSLPSEGEVADEEEVTEEVEESRVATTPQDDVPGIKISTQPQGEFPIADAICLAIGCLIAYEVAKGTPQPSEEDESEEGEDSPAPAEQESSDDGGEG